MEGKELLSMIPHKGGKICLGLRTTGSLVKTNCTLGAYTPIKELTENHLITKTLMNSLAEGKLPIVLLQ